MISVSQAEKLIKLAKDAIISVFENTQLKVSEKIKNEFGEDRGVFVSLYVKDELNGCIGFPEPVMPLYSAVVDAAKSAAFRDPRFLGLEKNDLKDLRVELSVLTIPKKIVVQNPSEYVNQVKIGQDGLIVRKNGYSGLLLPQVATEWEWDAKSFLDNTCIKAGLNPECWMEGECSVYKFQAQVFSMEKGIVVEKKL